MPDTFLDQQTSLTEVRLLYSPDEVQRLLCMSRTRLWDHMSTGRIKYVTDGKRRFVRADELHRYIESLESS